MKKIQSRANNSNSNQLPIYVMKARGYDGKASKGFGANSPFLDGCVVGNAWLNSKSESEQRFILVNVAMVYLSTFDPGTRKASKKESFRDSLPLVLEERDVETFWANMPDEFSSELSRCGEWLFGFVSSITDRIFSDDFLTRLMNASKSVN